MSGVVKVSWVEHLNVTNDKRLHLYMVKDVRSCVQCGCFSGRMTCVVVVWCTCILWKAKKVVKIVYKWEGCTLSHLSARAILTRCDGRVGSMALL